MEQHNYSVNAMLNVLFTYFTGDTDTAGSPLITVQFLAPLLHMLKCEAHIPFDGQDKHLECKQGTRASPSGIALVQCWSLCLLTGILATPYNWWGEVHTS